jgi:hypothetical protein
LQHKLRRTNQLPSGHDAIPQRPIRPEPVFHKLWPVERDKLRDHLLLMNLWPPVGEIANERRGPFRLTSRPLKLGYSSEKGDFGWEKGRFVRKTSYSLRRL